MHGVRIAVIGAGPAGIYATESLLNSGQVTGVDVFDALPTPYGLVRYGVAPDHAKIKSVTRALAKIMSRPGVRFFGNVRYGTRSDGADIDLVDLRRHYPAVIFATGAPTSRRLSIDGEDLPGSLPAADFVSWYNGHPAMTDIGLRSARAVAVIGGGNVALDVIRMLARDPADLAGTDMPPTVRARLAQVQPTEVHLIARGGPAEVKFTLKELRELERLPGTSISVRAEAGSADSWGEHERDPRRRALARELARLSGTPAPSADRRIRLHLGFRPVAVRGHDSVAGVVLEQRRIDLDGFAGAAETRTELPVQLMFHAIGYQGAELPGLPFDHERAIVPHHVGRVAAGIYVAGWSKRGPTGVIGTNRADAGETVETLLADLSRNPDRTSYGPEADLAVVLAERDRAVVDWPAWLRIDADERTIGHGSGCDRIKINNTARLLSAAVGKSPLHTESVPHARAPG